MLSGRQQKWIAAAAELRPALELALELEHARIGLLMLRDDESGDLMPVLHEGLTDEQCSRFGVLHAGVGPLGAALAEQHRVIVPNALAPDSNGLGELARSLGFRGMDLVPLEHHGHSFGALAVFFRRARPPTARATRMVGQCAGLLSIALEIAWLRDDAECQRQNAEDVALARMQLLARSSHELRTPLQSIAGYIDLLRLGIPDKPTPRQEAMLARLQSSEKLLISAIDDLITYARLEAGRVAYDVRPVVAKLATVEAEAVVRPLVRRGVRLLVEHAPRNVVVMADATKVCQILVNLLANALKFTPSAGSVRLSHRIEDDTVSFDVTDSGPGIEPSQMATVFQPYGQIAAAAAEGTGGFGLGLAIARDFAAGMSADLSVRSTVGHGSVFTLRVPRAADGPSQ